VVVADEGDLVVAGVDGGEGGGVGLVARAGAVVSGGLVAAGVTVA
jgi:hypothetical protein